MAFWAIWEDTFSMKRTYRGTITACFISYIVQAIVNTFVPLLFLTFQDSFGISLSSISALITINFCVQLAVDLLAAKFVDRIGYRAAMLLAHGMAALGLSALAVLPQRMDPFWGLVISVCIYAIGGGLIEVVNSPVVEACPTKNKQSVMSLLHSFYCWGYVAVVGLSTIFFSVAGLDAWPVLALLWALVPLLNGLNFLWVPIAPILPEGQTGMPMKQLLKNRTFLALFVMMLCAGASEQSMSQWASAFAEKALHIPKAVGDLAGPLSFALCMGTARTLYSRFSTRLPLRRAMTLCAVLCIVSYLLACLSPGAVTAFIGCALCGFSVGLMWPGTFSLGSEALPAGGTAMFALFALAGDLGCSAGPTLVGAVSQANGGALKVGLLAAIVFPVGMLLAIAAGPLRRRKN